MRSVGPIRYAVLLSIAVAACPLEKAFATDLCDALRGQLADATSQSQDAPRVFANPSREPLLGELDDLEARAQAFGCSRGSIIVIDGPNRAACRRIDSLIDDIRARLDEAGTGEIGAQPGGSSSRAEIARQMRMNGCADAPPPIEGVSQFSDPESAGLSSLSPREPSTPLRQPGMSAGELFQEEIEPNATPSIIQVPEPPKGRIPDLSEALSGAEPGIDRLPPALHSKARPMTEHERHVRRVGPRFLPDPDGGLTLGPKDK